MLTIRAVAQLLEPYIDRDTQSVVIIIADRDAEGYNISATSSCIPEEKKRIIQHVADNADRVVTRMVNVTHDNN